VKFESKSIFSKKNTCSCDVETFFILEKLNWKRFQDWTNSKLVQRKGFFILKANFCLKEFPL